MITNDDAIPLEITSEKRLIICTKCRRLIPFYEMVTWERKVILKMRCTCDEEVISLSFEEYFSQYDTVMKPQPRKCCKKGHEDVLGEKYCTSCQVWLCNDCLILHSQIAPCHILSYRELSLDCPIHKTFMYSYCNDCNKSLCKYCVKAHLLHQRKPIDQTVILSFIEICTNIYAKTIDFNKKYKDRVIQMIDDDIKTRIHWKEEIVSAYDLYEKNLEEMTRIIDCIRATASIINDHPNYNFTRALELITFNVTLPVFDEKSIEENYTRAMQYFKTSPLIILHEEPIEEKEDVCWNIAVETCESCSNSQISYCDTCYTEHKQKCSPCENSTSFSHVIRSSDYFRIQKLLNDKLKVVQACNSA